VHVHEQGLIVRDDGGAPTQIIGALTDISERHNVAELGQRLAQASRLTAMGELTASIAHEINQPMSAILSNVDAAEMLLDRGNYRDSELREILDDIRADDVRAGEIIRHIRGLARPRESQPQYFSIRELIEGVLRLIAPMAQRRGIRLSASFGQESPFTPTGFMSSRSCQPPAQCDRRDGVASGEPADPACRHVPAQGGFRGDRGGRLRPWNSVTHLDGYSTRSSPRRRKVWASACRSRALWWRHTGQDLGLEQGR
jgi:signal transduction histidine kinase